jgi:hypothetical protein
VQVMDSAWSRCDNDQLKRGNERKARLHRGLLLDQCNWSARRADFEENYGYVIYNLGIGAWKNAQGSYMVQFSKYGKEVHIIVDSRFPSAGGDEWLFGRCENKKEIFTNIL